MSSSISSVSELNLFRENERKLPTLENDSQASFASMLNHSLSDVNELVTASDKKSVDLAVGRTENLHEAMIAFEKAETALKLLVQVRNKALDAYHEIMRMQV